MSEVYQTKNSAIPYRVIRSRRRTIGLEVGLDGTVTARIPARVSLSEAKEFVEEKQDWILKNQERMRDRREKTESVCWTDVKSEEAPWITGEGGELFREKISRWAEIMGVEYHNIRIKDVRSRWGSCSSSKNLNFSWKVFVMPERVVDYLVVHELAHLKQMNHSPAFWAIVEEYIPDYRKLKKELNGFA
jgi:predicted metal-dependent hydrolase